MASLKRVEKYFKLALDSGYLKFTLDNDYWLVVDVKTPNSATPHKDGYTYKFVCLQDIRDYKTPIELCNRITYQLASQLMSAKQDVNIFYQEWQPKGRA